MECFALVLQDIRVILSHSVMCPLAEGLLGWLLETELDQREAELDQMEAELDHMAAELD